MSVDSYRDLVVWQASMELVKDVYQMTAAFPKAEMYGLTAQLRRSVVSIASNIAEGHARGSTKEYQRFIGIALGSLAETETQLLIAKEIRMTDAEHVARGLARADAIGKMLRRIDQALRRKTRRSCSLAPSPQPLAPPFRTPCHAEATSTAF